MPPLPPWCLGYAPLPPDAWVMPPPPTLVPELVPEVFHAEWQSTILVVFLMAYLLYCSTYPPTNPGGVGGAAESTDTTCPEAQI